MYTIDILLDDVYQMQCDSVTTFIGMSKDDVMHIAKGESDDDKETILAAACFVYLIYNEDVYKVKKLKDYISEMFSTLSLVKQTAMRLAWRYSAGMLDLMSVPEFERDIIVSYIDKRDFKHLSDDAIKAVSRQRYINRIMKRRRKIFHSAFPRLTVHDCILLKRKKYDDFLEASRDINRIIDAITFIVVRRYDTLEGIEAFCNIYLKYRGAIGYNINRRLVYVIANYTK